MINFIRAALFSLLLVLPSASFATAQIPDEILVGGKKYDLTTNPLSKHPQIASWRPPKEALVSSANWRGHTAKWEIREDKLLLRDITIFVEEDGSDEEVEKSVLNQFYSESPVFADWYSGALVVPDGKLVNYVHMGYGSTYSHYLIFIVSNGKVTDRHSMSLKQFERYKEAKFEQFKKTEEFERAYQEALKESGKFGHEFAIDFIKSFYAEQYLSR